MKSNKKGFTLIELLAVIVILAIIALITLPVVINIINNAKKGAAEDSTYGVIEAAKLFWVSNQMDFEANNTEIVFTCALDSGTGKCKVTSSSTADSAIINKELEISGTKPNNPDESGKRGTITINASGVVVSNLKFGDYWCSTKSGSEKIECGASSAS